MEIVIQVIVNGLFAAAVYALIAGGISFLYATTKIFHLAHGAVVLIGGYAFWWFAVHARFAFPVAVILAIALSAIAGALINELVYETLRRRGTKGLGYLLGTLALLMLGTALILGVFGAAPKTVPFETASLVFGGIRITVVQAWMLAITTALLAFFYWLIQRTKFGTAMRATADNELVAEILGVNTRMIRRHAFLLASALAGVAGILMSIEFNLDPNMGALLAVKGFAAAVIGGVGSFGGALIGALGIGLIEQGAVWFLGAGWRNAATFIILFLVLLARPRGLFGKKQAH